MTLGQIALRKYLAFSINSGQSFLYTSFEKYVILTPKRKQGNRIGLSQMDE
jgi:hypothetical protein